MSAADSLKPADLPHGESPVLTPDLFYDLQEKADRSFRLHQVSVRGQQLTAADCRDWHLAVVVWNAARATGSAA